MAWFNKAKNEKKAKSGKGNQMTKTVDKIIKEKIDETRKVFKSKPYLKWKGEEEIEVLKELQKLQKEKQFATFDDVVKHYVEEEQNIIDSQKDTMKYYKVFKHESNIKTAQKILNGYAVCDNKKSSYNQGTLDCNYNGYSWGGWNKGERAEKLINKTTLNVVLFKQDFLDEIMNKCLPKAGGSEFQFHYRGMQIHIEHPDGEKLIFTLPTIFYNFSQKVSGGSVDFNMTEVKEVSGKLADASMKLTQMFAKMFPTKYFKDQDFNVRIIEGDMGSIHRHPGRFGFSSIDLDDDPEHPGVIYRTVKAEDYYQIDSVLFCGQNAELFTTETRLFNIEPVQEGDLSKGIKGTVETVSTLCYIDNKDVKEFNIFNKFFGKNSENKKNFVLKKFQTEDEYNEIDMIVESIFSKGYEPISVVDENNIEQSVSRVYGYYNQGHYGNSKCKIGFDTNTIPSKTDKSDLYEDLVIDTSMYDDGISLYGEKADKAENDYKELLKEYFNLKSIEDLDENHLIDLCSEDHTKTMLKFFLEVQPDMASFQVEVGTTILYLDSWGYDLEIGSAIISSSNWNEDDIDELVKEYAAQQDKKN